MKKTRVKEGEPYYWIMSSDGKFISMYDVDTNAFVDRERMKNGNYFNTEKEADAVARKLNAVLKGADAIKMPSEEDVESAIPTYTGCSAEFSAGIGNGWWQCYEWLKSKIVR